MPHAGPASLTLVPGSERPAWPALRVLAFLLASEAGALAGRLAPATVTAVGDLVRRMNCYYSNLIEGHDTRPVDIERALRADLATEPRRRDLQLEATAHIALQAAIDAGELDGFATPSALMMEIHRRFYEKLPETLRVVEERSSGRRVEVLSGKLRTGHVKVGTHLAPRPTNCRDG
ncbi:MAG: Fic family protein [Roseomonas sp.]|jgi:Fic family protein|nr:Fic family protein [Roseomonas sp.]